MKEKDVEREKKQWKKKRNEELKCERSERKREHWERKIKGRKPNSTKAETDDK